MEPTHALSSAQCQLEVQVVNVIDGITDLHVENQGARLVLQLPRGLMIGEMRQLGATKVTTSHYGTVVGEANVSPWLGSKEMIRTCEPMEVFTLLRQV